MEFSVSSVIGRTLETFTSRFGPLLGIWALYYVIMLGAGIVFAFAFAGSIASGMMAQNPLAMGVGMIGTMAVLYIGIIVIALAQQGALIAMGSPLARPSFSEAMGAGLRGVLPLLGVILLYIVAYIAAALVISLLRAMLGSILGVLVLLLVVPGFVYLGCRLIAVFPIIVVERVGNPVTALTRSWALTEGKVLTIFLCMLVFMLAMVVLVGGLFWIFFTQISGLDAGGPPPGLGFGIGLFVGGIAISALVSMISGVYLAVVHAGLDPAGGDVAAAFE